MGYMDSSDAQNHHHQHQEMCSQTLESMLMSPKSQQEKKPRPADQQALKCPRCDSTNTKFCYYNNYSLSQPRYFCKSCRRYWTKGGTLRNVPVGGGCRKNKRSSPSSTSSSSRRSQDRPAVPGHIPSLTPPNLSYDSGHDLSLAIASLQQKQSPSQLGLFNDHDLSIWGNTNAPDCVLGTSGGLFEALRSGFLETSSSSPSGFQNPYCGMGNGGNPGMENGDQLGFTGAQDQIGGIDGLMISGATTASTAVTTVKQEIACNGGGSNRSEAEGRLLWGFPWQNLGDEFDCAGRINWQGLLNSPLM